MRITPTFQNATDPRRTLSLSYREDPNRPGISIHTNGYDAGPPLLTYAKNDPPLSEDQLLYIHTLMAVSVARSNDISSFVHSVPNGVMQDINNSV